MDETRFSQLRICEDDEVIDRSERDRLSELPDSLILSILSFLSMIDVVRTTILSKRWKDLWATIPCLNFCFSDDYHLTNRVESYGVDFISGALAKWKGVKMQTFSLSFKFRFSLNSYTDSWLIFAIEKQVEEFFIHMDNNWESTAHFLPQRFYSCSSITKLYLAIFNLQNIVNKVQWNNLKSLTIRLKDFLSVDAMNQVLSGAPQLEELSLSFRELSEDLNIRSTSLKTLKIELNVLGFNRDVGIWAPNLVTLELSGLTLWGCSLVVPSLTHAILSLQKIDWEFLLFETFNQVFYLLYMKARHMDVPFSNAKFLKFYAHEAEEILAVSVIFPKLMHTIVDQRAYTKDLHFALEAPEQLDYSKACFRSPSLLELKRVEITWPVGDASILRVMEYLLENAHMLEKMVLRLRMDGADPETIVLAEEKVRSMPRSSPTAQLIITKI